GLFSHRSTRMKHGFFKTRERTVPRTVAPLPSPADTAATTPMQRVILLTNHRQSASILPPHVARQNVQFGAVLGHSASRDRNASLGQNFDDLLVAQRRVAILVFHQIEDSFFYAGVAHRFASGSLISGREKVFHFKNALRRGHVFAGNSAAHRGLVDANRIGEFTHGHWLQMRWAVFKKDALP